eukprot:9979134-Lingulodinium_polyedra.AAC.1
MAVSSARHCCTLLLCSPSVDGMDAKMSSCMRWLPASPDMPATSSCSMPHASSSLSNIHAGCVVELQPSTKISPAFW